VPLGLSPANKTGHKIGGKNDLFARSSLLLPCSWQRSLLPRRAHARLSALSCPKEHGPATDQREDWGATQKGDKVKLFTLTGKADGARSPISAAWWWT